jgi:hypothetical protein
VTCLLEDLAFLLLARILGCPCCGPPWYRDMSRRWYQRHGLPVPPELGGQYSRPEGP